MAESNGATAEAQIETVVVDPDDVVEALRFNAQPREYTNRRSAVLRVSPSFSDSADASIHYSEEGNYYPPEMDPKPIHINPRAFVEDSDDTRVPNRADARARAKELLDDPTDEEIETSVQTEYEVWEEFVRSALKDETDINNSEFEHGSPHVVTVEYDE